MSPVYDAPLYENLLPIISRIVPTYVSCRDGQKKQLARVRGHGSFMGIWYSGMISMILLVREQLVMPSV